MLSSHLNLKSKDANSVNYDCFVYLSCAVLTLIADLSYGFQLLKAIELVSVHIHVFSSYANNIVKKEIITLYLHTVFTRKTKLKFLILLKTASVKYFCLT